MQCLHDRVLNPLCIDMCVINETERLPCQSLMQSSHAAVKFSCIAILTPHARMPYGAMHARTTALPVYAGRIYLIAADVPCLLLQWMGRWLECVMIMIHEIYMI